MNEGFFNIIWFVVLALMLTGYAVLDGFDLGVGALHLFVARTEEERQSAINAIGPVWNGNEVWLLAAGGSMVAAFPHLYASGFSGFYLALMLVLWLLILRGIGIEFRHQVETTIWREAWDVVFWGASLLLSLLFGVAVGNVLIGVPMGANGLFQGSFAIMLNWFAILGGLLSVSVLALHGANYLAVKTEGAMQGRARALSGGLFWSTVVLLIAVTAASFVVRPNFMANYTKAPALFVFTLLGVAAVAALFVGRKSNNDRLAFAGSCALIVSILTSVAAGLFPMLLPSRSGVGGLDIYNAAAPLHSLQTAFFIYLVGIVIVITYLVYVYRIWSGKVSAVGGYHS